MKIKITSQNHNPLLKRRELAFEVEHKETKGTPSRLEIRKELASKLKKDIELVYVRRMETQTGTMITVGEATAYDSAEKAKLLEPEHILIRNTPQKKTEEEKQEKKIEKEEEKKEKEEGESEGEEASG
ncbi:MAG: 30S ribosomal protein S24e [Candidatus Bathyarchaeota archaeon]|nr:MAG: 30S ribosomal protein S24e [Candidatus Bathyarchaeota archaeon]